MTNTDLLVERNRQYAETYAQTGLPVLPKMRTVVLGCVDARVDPAHLFNLELGDVVVIRNNGGRVTPEVVDELVTLSIMVANLDGAEPGPFEVMIVHHTQCGAERFADPGFQKLLREKAGVDVSARAIVDHEQSLWQDVERLHEDTRLPRSIIISAYLYDLQHAQLREVLSPVILGESIKTIPAMHGSG